LIRTFIHEFRKHSDTDQLLDLIIQKSLKAVKAEQGSLMLVTPQGDQPLKTLIRQEDLSGSVSSYRVGAQITGWVLKNKKPLRIDNLAEDERFSLSAQESARIQTVMCVPVLARGQMIGVLIMTNKKTGESFSDDDLRLLSIIAAQSGQLIRNAQLQAEAIEKKKLEHQLELARRIQHELLPNAPPQTEHLRVSSLFKPHTAVGGDYYDYYNLGKNKTGVVIADVSGHGPSAALLMSMIKGVLYALAEDFESAGDLVERLNNIVSQIIPSDMFITMMFLVFDFERNQLSYANAGHPPLIHYKSATNTVEQVGLKGCAINVLPGCSYKQKEIQLKKDDTFLIYTDGLIETTDPEKNMFHVERLCQVLLESITHSPQEIITDIENQLNTFSGSVSQEDDRVAIVLRVS
jgi:sigma-B regulation protein RsbU (phosphoserine phosphatase)